MTYFWARFGQAGLLEESLITAGNLMMYYLLINFGFTTTECVARLVIDLKLKNNNLQK